MLTLFEKYKYVIRFVILFFGTYLILSLLYILYLQITGVNQSPDPITNLVAKQSSLLLESVGFDAQVMAHEAKPQMKLFVDKKHIANIIEGCNGVSIITLFVAFVIAFAQNFKKTTLFILAGIALLYAVNILRIAILAIALQRYPEQESILHGVVFPGLIYGMVFLLWIAWVRTFKNNS